MFIHLEDWSLPKFISILRAKGLPNIGKLIKVYATYHDPRETTSRFFLVVCESDHAPFKAEEVFAYKERESYFGNNLELKLDELGLQTVGRDVSRALFRFANKYGFCQIAMAAKHEGKWLFDHPFEDIDGLDREGSQIHLDIFYPSSIQTLKKIADINNKELVPEWREHRLLMEPTFVTEGQRRHPER